MRIGGCLLLLCFAVTSYADNAIGKVLIVKGVVSAQAAEKPPRILGKRSEIYQGDKIITAKKGFVVIKMIDDSKVTLRPSTEFVIDKYDQTKGAEKIEVSLVKGGLRALTGAIAKRRPEAYKMTTPVASLGIRGTDYSVRYCEADCEADEDTYDQHEIIKTDCLFQLDGIPPGLYATVFEDKIFGRQGNNETVIDPPKAIYADQSKLVCLAIVPKFIRHDPILKLNTLSDDAIELFNILREDLTERLECVVSD